MPSERPPRSRDALPTPDCPVVMRQRWRDLLFLHWPLPPEVIQNRLPAGLKVDTYGGDAYLGVVPFSMEGVRPARLPAVPGLSSFGELNLRTYVVGPDGLPGVWFFSLDAHQRVAVWVARTFFALPYHHARIAVETGGEPRRTAYRWSRGGPMPPKPAFDWTLAGPPRPAEPGSLAAFLAERYVLFSHRPRSDRLYAGRVDHEPYGLCPVELNRHDTALFGLNGFAAPTGPPTHVTASRGVDVAIHPLRRVTTR
ncbi:MAG: DUF2071 domain-containing protein [Planctomycetota bacterium]